jgi:type I restriction enzyme S subunit
MIADLKPYAKMKDSGVSWLGLVPEHWEHSRLKQNVSNINMQTAVKAPAEIYIALEHVESWTGRVRMADPKASFDSQLKRFSRGDVLFCKLRPYLAKVARPTVPGVCVGEFLVLRSRQEFLLPAYLELLLRTKPVVDAINASTFGARMPRADWQFIGSMRLAFPPAEEQAAIVRFLDHADRCIRRYINVKRKLVQVLEERKRAIIHTAVTRGLDPNVPLSPSGIQWIGDTPEHWKLVPNHLLMRRRKVLVGVRHTEFRLLSLTKGGVIIRDVESGKGKFSSDMGSSQEVRAGDLIFCLFDIQETPRTVGLSEHDGMITGAYTVMEPTGIVRADFLELFYRAMDDRKLLAPLYSGLRNTIPPTRFLGIKTPVPPVDEQLAIVRFVNDAVLKIDNTGSQARREIGLLQECRTRLIADVTTGKLDVREASLRLPEDVAAYLVEEDGADELLGEAVDDEHDTEFLAADEEAA